MSIWEIRLKHNARHSSGAQNSRFSPEDVLEALEDQNITLLPMTMLHAVRALKTPLGHKDPFDKLLLVQTQEESLRLLTVDRDLIGHPLAITAHELE